MEPKFERVNSAEKQPESTFSTVPTITGENIKTEVLNLNLEKDKHLIDQVKEYVSANLSKIKNADKIALPGQAHASGIFLALTEMIAGLPKKALLVVPGSEPVEINLSEWRHEASRDARGQRIEGSASGKTFVLQGGHPISADQHLALAEEMGTTVENLVFVPFGDNKITTEEISGDGKNKIISALVEASQKAGMTVGDWESGKVAYAPAGLGALGTLQTTAIYGISGQWPNMIRLASNPETRQFELAEVIGLQSLRQEGKNLEESGMIKMDKEMIKNLLEKIRSEFGNTPEFKMIEEKLN